MLSTPRSNCAPLGLRCDNATRVAMQDLSGLSYVKMHNVFDTLENGHTVPLWMLELRREAMALCEARRAEACDEAVA